MKISKEILIGIVAIITLLVSIWGYKYLKGKEIFSNDNEYYVVYPRIDQLSSTAPVLINGFQVGTVLDIYLDEKRNNAIVVHFSVKQDINVPKGSKANIISTSILGGKAIQLKLNGVCDAGDCAPSGSYLEGKLQGVLQSIVGTDDIDSYVTSLSAGVDQFIDSLDRALKQSEAQKGVGKSMQDLQATIENLKTATSEINTLITSLNKSIPSLVHNLNGIAQNINNESETIDTILSNLAIVTTDLKNAQLDQVVENADKVIKNSASTIAAIEKATNGLKKLIHEINTGGGSLGKLIKDETLYINLKRSSHNLDLLLQDIRLNPSRYINISVFERKDKGYTLPENDPAYKE